MAKSVEEQVENWAKQQLHDIGVHAYAKTEAINTEIQDALAKWPSKSGGAGPNYPDLKVFIQTAKGLKLPVMIEVKGTQGFLVKTDEHGNPQLKNVTAAGKPDYTTINKYAVNGAIHYANGVIAGTKSYKSVIAIGLNGWKKPDGILTTEMVVYYVSQDYFLVPKEIGKYADMSFLKKEHEDELIERINNLSLSEHEKEEKTRDIENSIERSLKDLNQKMRDELHISAQTRVFLISGIIIAGLGHHKEDGTCVVAPLDSSELTGEPGKQSNDGVKIFNKISSVLAEKNLPEEKRNVILEILHAAFYNEQHYTATNGESPLKVVYKFVQENVMVYFNTKYHLDFTGRLFNVMNSWAHDPNDPDNDVVLTPRYVAEFMARMCRVNKDSYVWDYAAGSAGFLVSAMKLMVEDAEKTFAGSPAERDRKILSLKLNQLLGIEILQDVYMLAVLNMILMGDGSSNIINDDSMKYDGTYRQGQKKDLPFPADVFLLNPPYSAPGKGLVFVEKALSRMSHGRAAVLIMENAGSGKGLPYAKQILSHSSLIASIHMADIFCGKAGVQTAVYVFEVGIPHDVNQPVKFIDFSNDGYDRQNRKKASLNTNLKDTGGAKARYNEVVNLVLYGPSKRNLIPAECYIEDTISLDGEDWAFAQHRKIDMAMRLVDFQDAVKDYLAWKLQAVIKGEGEQGKIAGLQGSELTVDEKAVLNELSDGMLNTDIFSVGELFTVKSNPQLNKESFDFSHDAKYPYFTRTVTNNGIFGYVNYLDEDHKICGRSLAVGMLGMQFFYMDHDYYAGQFTKSIRLKAGELNEFAGLFFATLFNKAKGEFQKGLVRDFERLFTTLEIALPVDVSGSIDYQKIETLMSACMKNTIKDVVKWLGEENMTSKV